MITKIFVSLNAAVVWIIGALLFGSSIIDPLLPTLPIALGCITMGLGAALLAFVRMIPSGAPTA